MKTVFKHTFPLLFIILAIAILRCASANHASSGWKYLNRNDFSKAKDEFESSLANDTLPGSLSGMSKALEGLNKKSEAKKFLTILQRKFPEHRFTSIQIEAWNKKYPDDKITQ